MSIWDQTLLKKGFSTGKLMVNELYSNDFAEAFRKLLKKAGVSCYKIAQYTGLDESYLSRLRNGDKANPSASTIVKICLAIANFSDNLELHDFESLLNSVGRSLFTKN